MTMTQQLTKGVIPGRKTFAGPRPSPPAADAAPVYAPTAGPMRAAPTLEEERAQLDKLLQSCTAAGVAAPDVAGVLHTANNALMAELARVGRAVKRARLSLNTEAVDGGSTKRAVGAHQPLGSGRRAPKPAATCAAAPDAAPSAPRLSKATKSVKARAKAAAKRQVAASKKSATRRDAGAAAAAAFEATMSAPQDARQASAAQADTGNAAVS